METTILRRLPPVSARGALSLAGLGILSITAGLFAGAFLLVPAGCAFALGLACGLTRWFQVLRGRAYPREGKLTLAAATFVNGSLAAYVALAGFILLRFGA